MMKFDFNGLLDNLFIADEKSAEAVITTTIALAVIILDNEEELKTSWHSTEFSNALGVFTSTMVRLYEHADHLIDYPNGYLTEKISKADNFLTSLDPELPLNVRDTLAYRTVMLVLQGITEGQLNNFKGSVMMADGTDKNDKRAEELFNASLNYYNLNTPKTIGDLLESES